MYEVTLIPGDGIGPEVAAAAVRVLSATGIEFEWETVMAGAEAAGREGNPLPPAVLESIKRTKIALKGPTATPIGTGHRSVNVALRKTLDLYAGLEHEVVPGVVESLKIITEKASTNIARFAFEHARTFGRKRVTAIHKANIMKLGDGLFLDSIRKVSTDYIDITYDERIVDAACMHLVMHPEKMDVLLLPNLYGDIVSDLCAGLVGGLGVVPGANLGRESAVFEAVHGSAPDIAHKNLANPTALLLSALMMLDHIGEREKAEKIRAALAAVLTEGTVRTRDLGGTASTTEFTDAVCRALQAV